MKYGVFLAVLASTRIATAQPGSDAPQNEPPAPTRATFVSTGEESWDVWVDKQPACQTPCSIGLLPLQFVVLRSQERNPIRLDVGYMPAGDLMVTAKPLSSGMYATGIVFTTFSGMALATGITLAAVGCSTDRSGMCTAGLVTGGVGAVGLYGSIYLMRKALPKVSVGAARPYVAGTQVGLAGTF
jgi:hypothetical protein